MVLLFVVVSTANLLVDGKFGSLLQDGQLRHPVARLMLKKYTYI